MNQLIVARVALRGKTHMQCYLVEGVVVASCQSTSLGVYQDCVYSEVKSGVQYLEAEQGDPTLSSQTPIVSQVMVCTSLEDGAHVECISISCQDGISSKEWQCDTYQGFQSSPSNLYVSPGSELEKR